MSSMRAAAAGSSSMRAATCARVDGRHAGIMLACVRHVQMRRLAAAAAAGAAAAGGASPSQPGDAAAAAASSSPSSSPSSQRRAAAAPSPSDLRAQLRGGGGGFAAMASVATVGTSSSEIYFGLAKAIDIYLVVLTGRVLLSWFRNLNWEGEPLNSLRALTDPFLNCFRGLVPSVAGIDLSPMVGFFGLQFLRGVLIGMA